MTIAAVDPARPQGPAVERGGEILRAGGLVAFPTETVYGLGANALDPSAVRRIFEAKGRPPTNPLIVHVGDAEAALGLVTAWPDAAGLLASRFWPGPLTLVLPKRSIVPDIVTAGLPNVAVRVPHHPVALALLRAAAIPVAAPSANRYTRVSPTTAAHVAAGLGDAVDLILDGGPTPVGIESTVVSLLGDRPVQLRPGTITLEAMEAVVGPVQVGGVPDLDLPLPSPGLARVHYAPRASLRVFADRDAMAEAALAAEAQGLRVGQVVFDPLGVGVGPVVVMPRDAGAYAARLYAALHELDAAGCDVILVEAVPPGGEWGGIRDRLERAAR